MTLLAGMKAVAFGTMPNRPLANYLRALGAEVVAGDSDSLNGADFLIEDIGLAGMAGIGFNAEQLRRDHPSLIHVSVTTFGSSGPNADWRGGELIASAMGGTLLLTGEPDLPPVKEALHACTFHADMVAASGAMAALYSRLRSGRGQHIDISIQEVTFNRGVSSIVAWQFDRRKLRRVGGALSYGLATVRCIWRLADGWCFHSLMTGRFGAPANQALSDWMDEAGMPNPMRGTDWLAYNRSTLDPAIRAQWEQAIDGFFRTRTKKEIAQEGLRRGVNACVVAEPDDVLASDHLETRDFWALRDGVKIPSRFTELRRGESAAPIAPRVADRPGPLAGLRVLDFSWALVGSITTKTLGDLGAEVIKVESRTRPCLSRIDVQVGASAAGSFDDKPWFAHLNSSKKSLALDMKRPEAWELLGPLIDWADIVVENFSPGTMAKLGLDYDSLRARNPSIIMVSGSVYGQTGPLAQEWGVDGTGAALSGRTFLTGLPDRDPVIPGSVPYGDVIVPFVMAATAAAAAVARAKSGAGSHVDASMYEVCVQQMRSALVDAQTNGPPKRAGNADPDVALQDVYPAAGDDRWIAISLPDAEAQARLYAFIGGEDVSAWTAARDAYSAAAELQAQGFAAGAVQDIEDMIERDLGLAERQALVTLEHPLLGSFGHVRTPISFSDETIIPYRAPSIGEHILEIARDVAGLDPDRIGQLIEIGVFK